VVGTRPSFLRKNNCPTHFKIVAVVFIGILAGIGFFDLERRRCHRQSNRPIRIWFISLFSCERPMALRDSEHKAAVRPTGLEKSAVFARCFAIRLAPVLSDLRPILSRAARALALTASPPVPQRDHPSCAAAIHFAPKKHRAPAPIRMNTGAGLVLSLARRRTPWRCYCL
jgi:hypothetical protein